MTSSVGPEMKFLRWILSHLTLILLISLLIYLFWNRNEIWPEEIADREVTVERHTELSVAKKIDTTSVAHVTVSGSNEQGISDQDTRVKELGSNENNYILSHSLIDESTDSYSSSNFSERMEQYRKSLPVDEREEMDKAEEIFQQVSDGTIKFPSQSDVDTITGDPEILLAIKPMDASVEDIAIAKMSQYSSEVIHNDSQYEIDEPNIYKTRDDYAKKTVVTQAAVDKEMAEKDTVEGIVEQNIVEQDTAKQSIKEKQSDSVVLDNLSNLKAKAQTAKVQEKETHTQDLQYQIRKRQRQLQNQMVMLVPLGRVSENNSAKKSNAINDTTYTRKKNNNYQFKPIKPVINTPQQRIMLKEARSAFDKQNFIEAEAKYRQVMKELPELPDVVGELANVYRTQNKVSDYLTTNTLFIKRLVNHKRYNEAWNVVKMTSRFNKEVAEQQRKIILREQVQ